MYFNVLTGKDRPTVRYSLLFIVTERVGRPTHLHHYFVLVTPPPSLDALCSQFNSKQNIFYTTTITKKSTLVLYKILVMC